MKISKIIKGIMGLGIVGGTAYLAYKIGEANGEINERYRDDDSDIEFDEDEIRFYGNMDEPDDGCIAPAKEYTMEDLEDISLSEEECENDSGFLPLDSITLISKKETRSLLLFGVTKGFISNKCIRDILNVDFDKAMEIISEFQKAGYIGEKAGNYRYPVKVKFDNYVEFLKAERENEKHTPK